jgi:hypothetical protein
MPTAQLLFKIGIFSLLLSFALPLPTRANDLLKPEKSSSINPLIAIANQKRTALVIGNSSYQKAGTLRNPVNDANDIAQALQQLGFDVILLKDATLRQMGDAIEEFNLKLRQGGVGVFYYAGHGVQVEGENYLIPIDTQLMRQQDVRYETLPVGKVLGAMEDAANGLNIVILDACRDNPLPRQWQRSTAGGLAPIQAVRGSYIAYATAPGEVAADGTGRNGIFTANILQHIKTPNLTIEEMFKRVRQGVAKDTNNQQIPWDSSSLIGEFSFNSGSSTTPTSTTFSSPSQPVTPINEANVNSGYEEQVRAYHKQAVSNYLNQNYEGALADLDRVIAIAPDRDSHELEARILKGMTYLRMGNYQQAMAECNQAIESNPEDKGQVRQAAECLALGYTQIADLRKESKDFQGALQELARAEQLLQEQQIVNSSVYSYVQSLKAHIQLLQNNQRYMRNIQDIRERVGL